jgi:hypothetical protein
MGNWGKINARPHLVVVVLILVLVLVVVLVLEGWGGFDFADRCSNRFLSREYGFCPEGPARNASHRDAGGDSRTQPGV